MKHFVSALLMALVMAFSVNAVEPYIRATLTPGDAGVKECHEADALFTEAAWGLGGGADIINFTQNTVLGADFGVKVHHLDFGFRGANQELKDRKTALDFELTPYIKYKAPALNFGFGPIVGVRYNDTKYDLDHDQLPNAVSTKGFDIEAGGRIFAEIPFKNERFAFVPAINYSRAIYTNYHDRLNEDNNTKGWFCDHYTNNCPAWASFSIRCAL